MIIITVMILVELYSYLCEHIDFYAGLTPKLAYALYCMKLCRNKIR